MMKRYTTRLLLFTSILITFLFLSACLPGAPDPAITLNSNAKPLEGDEDGYSADYAYPAESGYPMDKGYPAPSTSALPRGPKFSINDPLRAGQTQVTGTGPQGVPILLVNVSEVGAVLAETIISPDGTFTFKLDAPLESGHMIGLQLGDLVGTGLDPEDFVYSETYFVRPLIGILFDMAPVEE